MISTKCSNRFDLPLRLGQNIRFEGVLFPQMQGVEILDKSVKWGWTIEVQHTVSLMLEETQPVAIGFGREDCI